MQVCGARSKMRAYRGRQLGRGLLVWAAGQIGLAVPKSRHADASGYADVYLHGPCTCRYVSGLVRCRSSPLLTAPAPGWYMYCVIFQWPPCVPERTAAGDALVASRRADRVRPLALLP